VILKTALAAVAILAALALLVRIVEPRFAFYPLAGESTTPAAFGVAHETLSVATQDGEQLHGWRLTARPAGEGGPSARGAPGAHVVYFHGNGGNLSIWAPILAGVARRGYAVTAFDYRGYGNSTGRPSERGLYRDVDAVLERFWSGRLPQGPVVYWGRSLGGTMAAYAATKRPPDGLILESAFPDVRTLVRSSPPMALLSLFSTYRFPAAGFLQKVGSPVLVMHGDADSVIPIGLGRALFERIPGPKRFVTIAGGDHNDLSPRDAEGYWKAVGDFIAGV
jgi:fermentation-respiration switch protein FrsA (DUF1100 family)